MTHPNLTQMQQQRNEDDLRFLRRKVTQQAHQRMVRTARDAHAAALQDGQREQGEVVPDADDAAMGRAGVLT